MTKDEVLKLALEALEDWNLPLNPQPDEEIITAIKEALMSGTDGAQPEQEPVATDWERIARVQDAKLRAMCNEAGGFEKLCEVMDKYERTTPPQRKPLTDEEIAELWLDILGNTPASGVHEDGLQPWRFARAIEAAHGIKGEA